MAALALGGLVSVPPAALVPVRARHRQRQACVNTSAPSRGGSAAQCSAVQGPAEADDDVAWGTWRRRGLASALMAGAASLTVLSFPGAATAGTVRDLTNLAAASIPYDEAFGNGKPTVVEFYADWCEVCKDTAVMVAKAEAPYRGQVNFVMLNIDNPKWAAEVNEFGVDGIPHFSFLASNGDEMAYAVGRISREVLEGNLEAMANGQTQLPYASVEAESSAAESRSVAQVQPRSHSQAS